MYVYMYTYVFPMCISFGLVALGSPATPPWKLAAVAIGVASQVLKQVAALSFWKITICSGKNHTFYDGFSMENREFL